MKLCDQSWPRRVRTVALPSPAGSRRQVNPLRHHPFKPVLKRDLQEQECLARLVEFLAEEDRAARRLVDQL
jgi:hypothetical protein